VCIPNDRCDPVAGEWVHEFDLMKFGIKIVKAQSSDQQFIPNPIYVYVVLVVASWLVFLIKELDNTYRYPCHDFLIETAIPDLDLQVLEHLFLREFLWS
jgi:hypothetical protein